MYMKQEFAEQYVHDEELPSELVSVIAHAIREQLKQAVSKLQRHEDAVPFTSSYTVSHHHHHTQYMSIHTCVQRLEDAVPYVCVCACVCVCVCVCVCCYRIFTAYL